LAARDAQRLAAWTQALDGMAASLQQEWQQAGAHTARQQEAICDTLARTARDISAQTEAHASNTLAEIARLMQAASEAPRAAAEVIAELRQKLSDSMVRDNAMLDERSRILGTLETLLGAVNHASTEQRSAIDALVNTSADLLERVGTQFTDKVASEADKMTGIAAQLNGSAVEVASLGEAFGQAVQLFSDSNDKLGTQLQRIEGALGKSMARSDEQLAYYVAQAREVIELSTMSQKQIVEDLLRLAETQRALTGSEA
jgi:DNA anti-recombination protein RmuC